MLPQQPPYGSSYGPTLPTPQPEQYDFILNGGQPPRPPLIGNDNAMVRLAIVVGSGLLLLLAAWVFISILSSATSLDTTPLIKIAQQQTELVRISQVPVTSASVPSTSNFAATTQLSLLSEQQVILKFLKKHGNQPSNQTLQQTQNMQTDSTLQSAQATGKYDQTYISIAQNELSTYEQSIQQAYSTAKSQNEKQILISAYNHAQLLVQQSKQQ